MPRVSLSKKKYKVSDLSKYIASEMYAQDISQEELAMHLGITQPGLSYKMKNNAFSYGDLLTIFDVFGTPNEKKAELMTL